MALYEKQYTKPYPDGYVDKPVMTTPVTAAILNRMDAVLAALEEFLASDEVGFKDALTVGTRKSGTVGNKSLVVGAGVATGENSLCVGTGSANGKGSFSTGSGAATANYANAEGDGTKASGLFSHAEGQYSNATNECSHSEGVGTTASGAHAHAEGEGSIAYGTDSHAEGMRTTANAMYAHAEGASTQASGTGAHAENLSTKALGTGAHAEGQYTIASGQFQHVQGQYNEEDAENKYAHVVGGGTYTNRKNIHTVDWQGNAVFAGDVTNGNGVSLDGLMALIGTTGQLRTIVTELPTEDISTETIYMVLKESGSENDIYNEYINVDGTVDGWEFIGSSAVDLTDYYTKEQVDELLAGYVASETGKGLSSEDYTTEDQALVESIRTMTAADALAILNGEVA